MPWSSWTSCFFPIWFSEHIEFSWEYLCAWNGGLSSLKSLIYRWCKSCSRDSVTEKTQGCSSLSRWLRLSSHLCVTLIGKSPQPIGVVKPCPAFSCLVVAYHATAWCLQTGWLYMLEVVVPAKPIETVKHHSDIISLWEINGSTDI